MTNDKWKRLNISFTIDRMTLTLPSFAKINWTLEILGKRPDGYHEVRTLLQTVSVADELTFELAGQGITVHCDHSEVPCDC
jgi:4-diphosphocytidyl-2-C-methyl-D-erythritol kinase